jgi:hypothetical protein
MGRINRIKSTAFFFIGLGISVSKNKKGTPIDVPLVDYIIGLKIPFDGSVFKYFKNVIRLNQ